VDEPLRGGLRKPGGLLTRNPALERRVAQHLLDDAVGAIRPGLSPGRGFEHLGNHPLDDPPLDDRTAHHLRQRPG
jgi:hypothetical protein